MSDNFSSAVQYLQENKDKYSLGELKEKLKLAGYSEDLISKAEQAVSSNPKQRGNNIKDFFKGFLGVILGVFLVLGVFRFFVPVVSLFIAGIFLLIVIIFTYFKIRKKRKYVARGVLWGFFLWLLLVALVGAFLIYLMMFW
ncbi:hypothetical protein A2442_03830 [Candidatus Campbellbacteria bacterium RIFOXYC2_FULL_35_25]|uniref:Uncharacterized protein n=1 Tax=Candidatus Campbellbacteria bacterium RIFOXYC2_FULL_35_25 TaxID=1797582 RepID=A0A1F5EKD7_9BACT|nr:MAG: hypothetical protein A2442_03830 [Candidatus Campbellbacteria bacterium RIFOXYC2_FULL_35_25]